MGQAISTVEIDRRVHNAAFLPIHQMIYQLIPQLEGRAAAAKRYTESKNDETRGAMLDMIRQHEANISLILNMQIPVV